MMIYKINVLKEVVSQKTETWKTIFPLVKIKMP